VTLTDPVAAEFALRITLSTGKSAEKSDVVVPGRKPEVKMILRLPETPGEAWTTTEVSDTQIVPGIAEYPPLAGAKGV